MQVDWVVLRCRKGCAWSRCVFCLWLVKSGGEENVLCLVEGVAFASARIGLCGGGVKQEKCVKVVSVMRVSSSSRPCSKRVEVKEDLALCVRCHWQQAR
jgi:hypothetical protein